MAEEALRVLVEEKMCERAESRGALLRKLLEELKDKHPDHVRHTHTRTHALPLLLMIMSPLLYLCC